jgi:chromosome segregation ATPase
MRLTPFLVFVSITFMALAACGGGKTAPERALDAAEERVEEASEGIDEMQQEVASLHDEQARLRDDLDAAASSQVHLWEERLQTYREQLIRLPAEAEQRLEPELAQLERQVESLRATLDEYAAATADEASQLKTEVDSAIDGLRRDFDEFDQSLREAGAG